MESLSEGVMGEHELCEEHAREWTANTSSKIGKDLVTLRTERSVRLKYNEKKKEWVWKEDGEEGIWMRKDMEVFEFSYKCNGKLLKAPQEEHDLFSVLRWLLAAVWPKDGEDEENEENNLEAISAVQKNNVAVLELTVMKRMEWNGTVK